MCTAQIASVWVVVFWKAPRMAKPWNACDKALTAREHEPEKPAEEARTDCKQISGYLYQYISGATLRVKFWGTLRMTGKQPVRTRHTTNGSAWESNPPAKRLPLRTTVLKTAAATRLARTS
jgi:hypothetical protein